MSRLEKKPVVVHPKNGKPYLSHRMKKVPESTPPATTQPSPPTPTPGSTASVTGSLIDAMNPATPKKELRKLALSRNPKIAVEALRNPETPTDIFDKVVSTTTSRDVLNAVAGNRRTPQKTLRELARTYLPSREPGASFTLTRLAGNPACDADTLDVLAQSRWAGVLTAVAGNEKTSPHTLETLLTQLGGVEPTITAEALPNPNLSHNTMHAIVEGSVYIPDEDLHHLAKNPSLDKPTWEYLAWHPYQKVQMELLGNPCTGADSLTEWVSHPHPIFREKVASNVNATEETLAQLSADEDVLVRFAVARNEATPTWVLEAMKGRSSLRSAEENALVGEALTARANMWSGPFA